MALFFSGDPIVLQSFMPHFDQIFSTGFSTEVWQSVIEKLGKKGLWHVSRRRRLPCGRAHSTLNGFFLRALGDGNLLFVHLYAKITF